MVRSILHVRTRYGTIILDLAQFLNNSLGILLCGSLATQVPCYRLALGDGLNGR